MMINHSTAALEGTSFMNSTSHADRYCARWIHGEGRVIIDEKGWMDGWRDGWVCVLRNTYGVHIYSVHMYGVLLKAYTIRL